MAEAAYWILTQDSRQVTGRSLLAEDVLREAGIGDFSRYAMDPAITPNLDYFVEA
jgi:citronellol/citronellal dehydrogenase